jgi:hypothetical protein
MPRRPPYIEIALTFAVLVFVALVVAGGFDRPADDVAEATMRPK